jgi:hypothetical protein
MMNGKKVFFAFVALAGWAISLGGCGGPAAVPTSYNTFKSADGSFKIEYPAQWSAEGGGGKGGVAWAKFTSGNSEIKVETNVAGSLMGDIAKSTGSLLGGEAAEDPAPVALVHEQEKAGFEEDAGVQEQKAAPVKTGIPEARKAEFTGNKTFGGSIHGYRVTALSTQRRIRVVCQCPEAEWTSLKPAFDKIIETLSFGK